MPQLLTPSSLKCLVPATNAVGSWERLRRWLHRRVDQMAAGDFSRLPQSFAADDGHLAREAYATVLIAMEVIEGRRTTPGHGRDRNNDESVQPLSGPP